MNFTFDVDKPKLPELTRGTEPVTPVIGVGGGTRKLKVSQWREVKEGDSRMYGKATVGCSTESPEFCLRIGFKENPIPQTF